MLSLMLRRASRVAPSVVVTAAGARLCTMSAVDATAAGLFDDIRQRLHASAVPQQLPCRDDEFRQIYDFLRSKVQARIGG